MALLLLLHLGLVLWGAAFNSVTFDENWHVSSGALIAARGDYRISPVNPPLVKVLFALPALAAGARLPDSASVATGDQWVAGESFMRLNAHRYHRVFFAARTVVALLSIATGLLVWRFARRFYGPRGGLAALAFYVFSAEALAHGGVATLDVATGFGVLASIYAFWGFCRTGRRSWWVRTALALGFCALTRFSTPILGPIFLVLAALGTARGWFRRPGRVWLGLGLFGVSTLLILDLGYLGRTSSRPLAEGQFLSASFQRLQTRMPGLRLPLPDSYLFGLDIQAHEGEGETPTYLLGRIHTGPVWYYFPLAFLFKWPLGFLGALAVRPFVPFWRRRGRLRRHEAFLWIPGAIFLLAGMFLLSLNAGIRYMFPLIPLLCVWLGGLAAPRSRVALGVQRGARRWGSLAIVLAMLQAVEVTAAAPWYLSFFNLPSGGPGGGFRLLNDSNVDWGQGLIALRSELRRLGITRVHLCYHGTVDPAVYGIDYVPYFGGSPGRESAWIAVSSYYFVGLQQSMTTSRGITRPIRFNFQPLWNTPPAAVAAGCMYLFPTRAPTGPGETR